MKQKNWLKTLLTFAAPCKGKMALSVICAVISVTGGLVPYVCVYQILRMFIEETVVWADVLFYGGMSMAGYTAKIIFYGISTVLSHVSAYTILEGLRLKISDRLMRAPLGSVLSKPIGHIKSTVVDRVEDVEPPLAHMIPELSSNLLLPVAVFVALLVIDWRMAMASLVTIPTALVPMAAGMKAYNRQYAKYMESNARVNSVIVEYVEGIEVVKAFNQTSSSYKKFTGAVKSFRDFTMAWFKSTLIPMNLTFSILPTTLLGTLPAGVALYINGSLDPASIALCLMLSLGIVGPLMKATQFINEMKSMEYAVRDAGDLLYMEELHEEKDEAVLSDNHIRLNHVTFSYTGEKSGEVLHDVNLDLQEGSFTALVGPSGGGKSTVARLIARFWDVSSGSIEIGGVDIRKMPLKQLADTVSFVTQDNFLFDCSLMENIRLGNPKATDKEVLEAARAAQCDEFIGRLKDGWDTTAGEAGKQLSGGERQRIAIARAILKDAPVIILDEATAFTDPENEDKIQRSIMALAKGKHPSAGTGKTLLVIAHRLSTIQNADNIVVLKQGRVVDMGRQQELLERCGLYREMWKFHAGARTWAVNTVMGKEKSNV
ncbi:ABC transporter ATP-binding protein/permease [Ruminococcus sp. OA3]|uniref:ABC transporter ATP-binding protein n=1 Tax=Ruminococcus sp. OA3 TaxID=2914164 RepID=UPI001F06E318|nr:ABC transporter ATP-binding protein [Ruminococcus sp. OA3]MCH1983138.1 ABC transporter ATP-binding protein/permease [Ruminococcus sp. OA3]